MQELTKAYIYLAVTLVFISFAASPLYSTVSVATTNSARLHAKSIAGAINMAAASPSDNLAYSIGLPKNCAIEIDGTSVRIRYADSAATEEIIRKKGLSVLPATIDCSATQRLAVTKAGKTITVS